LRGDSRGDRSNGGGIGSSELLLLLLLGGVLFLLFGFGCERGDAVGLRCSDEAGDEEALWVERKGRRKGRKKNTT
jgi:integrase